MNPAAACFEIKQTANSVFTPRRVRYPGRLSLGNIIHHPFLKLPKPDISENLEIFFCRVRERVCDAAPRVDGLTRPRVV
jgi:hypothetical protein